MPKYTNCSENDPRFVPCYYMGLFRGPNRWFWPDNSSFFLNSTSSYQRWRTQNTENRCDNEPNGYLPEQCNAQKGDANATQILACTNFTNGNIGDWFDKNQYTSDWFYICQRHLTENQLIIGKFNH